MTYQTTLFSQLDPDVPLEPFVVLRTDARWDAALDELSRAPYVGLDTEFTGPLGPWKSKRDINYWKSNIRLIQVGLPSGLVLVFDLGGIHDDRVVAHCKHYDALNVLRTVIENKNVLKVGMHLPTEYLLLRIHLGWKMRGMRDIQLMSQVYWAGLGTKNGYFTPSGFVKQPRLQHTMLAIAERVGIDVDKTEQLSDWAGHLSNKQLNYASRDTLVPLEVWRRLGKKIKDEGLLKSVMAECDAQPAFCECSYNGLPIDLDVARADLAQWEKVRDEFLKPFKEKFPDVNPNSPAQVAAALSEALNHNFFVEKVVRGKLSKQPTTSDEVLTAFAHVPYVKSLLEGRSVSTCMKWLQTAIEHAFDNGTGTRIRTNFKQIAGGFSAIGAGDGDAGAGMGRSSASNPLNTQNPSNLQPLHEKAGAPSVRRAIRPAPGRAFIVADLSQAHWRIAAQWSRDPIMLRDCNLGRDAHLAMTHRVMVANGVDLTLEEAEQVRADKTHPLHKEFNSRRQGTKSTNYACVPLDSRALTREGWKTYDQLKIGEDILAYNAETQRNVWTPLLAITVLENEDIYRAQFGKYWDAYCTADHRWYGSRVKRIGGHRIRSRFYGDHSKYYTKIPGVFTIKDMPRDFRVRVSAPADGGEGLKNYQIQRQKYGYDWVCLVLRMTPEERRAFLAGCLISEGNVHRQNNNWMLAQKPNELGEAMLLAAYLEGQKVSVHRSKSDNGPLWRMCLNTTDSTTGQNLKNTFVRKGTVWCPTTALGTWVMRQDVPYKNSTVPRIMITGNCINLSGATTLKTQMETMAVPVILPEEEVQKLIDAWRELYNVLYSAQRAHIKRVNRTKYRFDNLGLSGEFGEARGMTGRRMYLIREWKKPFQREDGTWSEPYWSVKSTDAVSFVWMSTEADLIKYAMGRLVEDFDAHPEWDVRWSNFAHDEVDLDCKKELALAVAEITQRRFDEAMRWAGLVDLPVNEAGAHPSKLIKDSWAAK